MNWRVKIENHGEFVSVYLGKGFLRIYPGILVFPPNFIEKLFGITYEDKINKAVKKLEKEATIQNSRIKATEEALAKVTKKIEKGEGKSNV